MLFKSGLLCSPKFSYVSSESNNSSDVSGLSDDVRGLFDDVTGRLDDVTLKELCRGRTGESEEYSPLPLLLGIEPASGRKILVKIGVHRINCTSLFLT